MSFRTCRRTSIARLLLFLISPSLLRSEIEAPEDPVREMLVARFQTVQRSYRSIIPTLELPPELGLTTKELTAALDSLQQALSLWKIEFHSGYAAFMVQSATHELAVNPLSMPSILEEDDDVLLHESVHLSDAQRRRTLYGLYAELTFLTWVQDHLDEEMATQMETKLKRSLAPEDILRYRLWTPALKPGTEAYRALMESFRTSWICEIQAYYVQMLSFDHQLKQEGSLPLKQTADKLRKTFASETGVALTSENDMALTLFQSFNAHHVTEDFQDAVLACVRLNPHKNELFTMATESAGWDLSRAKKDLPYRRQLSHWARQTILRWEDMSTESLDLTPSQIQELRKNALVAPDDKNQT